MSKKAQSKIEVDRSTEAMGQIKLPKKKPKKGKGDEMNVNGGNANEAMNVESEVKKVNDKGGNKKVTVKEENVKDNNSKKNVKGDNGGGDNSNGNKGEKEDKNDNSNNGKGSKNKKNSNAKATNSKSTTNKNETDANKNVKDGAATNGESNKDNNTNPNNKTNNANTNTKNPTTTDTSKNPQGQKHLVSTKQSITFIYRRQDYTLNLLKKSPLSTLITQISTTLNVPSSSLEITLNNTPLSNYDQTSLISDIFPPKTIPLLQVKKKPSTSSSVSGLFPKSYINKVTIDNVSDGYELHQKIDQFYKDCMLEKDCIAEPTSATQYCVSFPYPDVAFDFNRFMLIQKSTDDKFKDIKLTLTTEHDVNAKKKGNTKKKEINIGNNNVKGKFDFALYVGMSGPYLTEEEMKRKEQKEQKEKWINKKGFIPYAKNAYSKYNNNFVNY